MKKNLLISFLYLIFQFGYLNSNAQWQQLNGPFGGTCNCIASDGTNIFAGTAGGVFLSTNNGNSWSSVSKGLTNTNVRSIVISGTNIFAASGIGLFLSKNNGNSWTHVINGLQNITVYSASKKTSNLL